MPYSPKAKEYAAIYARKSTKMESYSLQTQASLARKLIEEKNLFVYDIYEDEESATKYHPLHRPGFKRLIYDAMQEKFKTVVVFRRDRLARKVEDLLEIKNIFKKYGINIIYSNQGEFQTDDDSYISSFIENIIMSVDELEPGILRERITAGKEQKRLRGEYSGRAPFGCTKQLDDNDKKVIVRDNNSPIVEKIFSMFSEKVNFISDFNTFIESITNEYKSKNLNKRKIIDILLRPLYGGLITKEANQNMLKTLEKIEEGKFRVNKELFRKCTNFNDPIIKEDTWYKCLEKLKSLLPTADNLEEDDENYLFKNFVKCGSCGESVYLSNKKYQCLTGCINIDMDFFEDIVLEKIIDNILLDKNIKAYQIKLAKDLKDTIDKFEDQIENSRDKQYIELKGLISKYSVNKAPDYSPLIELIDEQKNVKKQIEKSKHEAVRINISLEKLQNIIKIKKHAVIIALLKRNLEITQEFFTSIIKNITVNNNSEVDENARNKFSVTFTK